MDEIKINGIGVTTVTTGSGDDAVHTFTIIKPDEEKLLKDLFGDNAEAAKELMQ